MHKRDGSISRLVALLVAAITVGGILYFLFTAPGVTYAHFRFNPYALLSATGAAITLGSLLFYLTRPARSEERVWVGIVMVTAGLYGLGEMLIHLSATPEAANFWNMFTNTAGAAICPAMFLVVMNYTNTSERRYVGTTVWLFMATLLFVFFNTGTHITFGNMPGDFALHPWGWAALQDPQHTGPGLNMFALWEEGLLFAGVGRLIYFRRHTRNPILRTQSLIFVFAFLIPAVVAVFFDVVLLAVWKNDPLPPLAGVLTAPAILLLLYGFVRYQLLTISPTLFGNTILGIMKEAVVATDGKFNTLYLNPTAEKMFGTSNTSNQGHSALSAFAPDSVATFRAAFSSPGDSISIPELEVLQGHDAVVPVKITASRLYLGNTPLWVMILTDITTERNTRRIIEHEVKVRTHELHEARAYLISSINSLEQGFVLVNHTGKVELANAVATKLLATSEHGDLTQQPALTALLHDGWDHNVGEAVDKVLASRRGRQMLITSADGSFYQVYLTPVIAGEQTLGATVVIQDITEAKILERSKDEFFSIASHELRTPLTAIRGNMSMLRDYFPEVMKDDSVKGLVNDTHSASVRLIEIVNDFLDSSSLEQGKVIFNIKPVAVAPLVATIEADLKMLTDQQHNHVVIENLDKLPPVEADEARLRQILYNLLSNANKYSENATITVSGVTEGKNVRIRITDTGKGISPENQKLLFHKFQQAGDSILTRDNTKGTGLGLYIAKLLADNMHGSVELEHTEEGKGSTFAVILPAGQAVKVAPSGKSESPAGAAK